MTAVAAGASRVRPRPAPRRGAQAAASPDVVSRLLGSWNEPNTWTVGILLATGAVILARHPIAHALGTEVDTPVASVSSAAPAVPGRPAHAVPALAPLAPAPTHAPRDPFRALLTAGAVAVAPSRSGEQSAVAKPASPSSPPAAVTPTCTTTHHVRSGESLWSIAATTVRTSNVSRVSLAWHRLYDANRERIGPDPALLRVGTSLCVPGKI